MTINAINIIVLAPRQMYIISMTVLKLEELSLCSVKGFIFYISEEFVLYIGEGFVLYIGEGSYFSEEFYFVITSGY